MTKASKPAMECGGKAKRGAAIHSFDFYDPDPYRSPFEFPISLQLGTWDLELSA